MGFYADVEANCRVYHTCDDHGNQFSYRCPEETAFRQDAMICDHAHLVDCRATVHPTNRIPHDDNSVDRRRPPSLARTFRVIQRPDVAGSDTAGPNSGKHRAGFVFSASLFLRDRDHACGTCDVDARNRATTTATTTTTTTFPRALVERYYPWDYTRNVKPPQSAMSTGTFAFGKSELAYSNVNRRPSSPPPVPPPLPSLFPAHPSSFPRGKSSPFDRYDNGNDNNDDDGEGDHRPYSETLRSIQASATTTARPTTDIPVHALTLSLKPLVPNELEYDPYYPRRPTTTEAYYTPSGDASVRPAGVERTSSSSSSTAAAAAAVADRDKSNNYPSPPFEIPPVLPDLNSLEDLVDRRKFFYIPRAGVKAI